MTITDLLQRIQAGVLAENEVLTAAKLQELQAFFGNDQVTEIRFYTGASSAFGHQATTLLLIRRIIQLGYTKTIRLVYEEDANDPVPQKLKVLLPGYDPNHPEGVYQLDGVRPITITAFSSFTASNPAEGQLGLTGGLEGKSNFADRLNVRCFLQLQPFQWTLAKNNLWVKGNATPTVLEKEAVLGSAAFIQQAYFMSPPVVTDAQWDTYTIGENGEDLGNEIVDTALVIADAVISPEAEQLNFMPVYGIGVDDAGQLRTLPGLPYSILFNLIAGIAYAQQHGSAQNKKGVIIGLVADIGKKNWEYLIQLINGEETGEDYSNVNKYITQSNLRNRVIFPPKRTVDGKTTYSFFSAELSNTIIPALQAEQILIVPIPNLPPDVFNYLYSIANYPFVFEGKGTANLALNLGKPYIHLAKGGRRVYPAINPGDSAVGGVQQSLMESMSSLMKSPSEWPADPTTSVGHTFGARLVEMLSTNADDALIQYFTSIANYYRKPENDKLVMALLFALPKYQLAEPAGDGQALRARRSSAQSALASLNDRLNTTLSDGAVALTQEVLGEGLILNFLTKIIDQRALELGGVTIDFSDSSQLVLSGQSDSFGLPGVDLLLTFNESEQQGGLALALQLLFKDTFTLLNSAWFTLEQVSIGLVVDEGASRIVGQLASKLMLGKDTELEIQMLLPSPEGELLFSGVLGGDLPNLEKIFQLVGGINFVKSFPAPLNVIANLGLSSFDFVYQLKQKKIASFGVGLATTQPWEVVKNITLQEGMSIQVNVVDPLKTRAVSWSANAGFEVISSDFGVGVSYPAKVLTAQMADDSDPLVVSELVKTYLGDSVDTPNLGQVTAFALFLDFNSPVSYLITCGAELGWPAVTIQGKALFQIEDVNFLIQGQGKRVFGAVQASTAILPDDPEARLDFSILAEYKESGGWIFEGTQTDGEVSVARIINTYLGIFDDNWKLEVGSENDLLINGIRVRFETEEGANAFEFEAQTAQPFEIPFPVDGAPTIEASVLIGYNQRTEANHPERKKEFYGAINGFIHWHGIDLNVFYNFDPDTKSFGIRWGILEGRIEEKTISGQVQQIAILSFTEGTTLGTIVETMISWATGDRFGLAPPWDVLNKIPLSSLSLTFNLTTKAVSLQVAIGPIELGFCRINSIGVTYDASSDQGSASTSANRKKRKVNIELNGSFFWKGAQAGEPLAWNAAKPEETPAAPGAGNKYFDLRVLAMGQHVTIPDFQKAKKVQEAIAVLKGVEPPERGKLPTVKFDPDSNWLFGTDFGVLRLGETNEYFLTLQIIFNDPALYALRIALDGKPAKIFAGLDFQIMYRQVSDTVGVYQTEITLPDLMRRLTIGAYTITLPVFSIAVYTNGDFLIDLGFPYNQDFSRSFSVEAIIPPGIPVLGSAGFYFGKLSSASTNRVPVITNGSFNPVIVFGFGAEVGFGKTFNAGILSAGIKLTVFGILEGVIAKFNAYSATAVSTGGSAELSGEYYFWLQGTFGIIGKIYGSVDFGIISADVTIEIKIMAQITFESYEDIVLSVIASVKAKASVKINLGLFKIKISFSFSLRVKQSFTFEVGGTPPWQIDKAATAARGNSVLARATRSRVTELRSLIEAPTLVEATTASPFDFSVPPNFGNLVSSANGKAKLTGYMTLVPTAAGDLAIQAANAAKATNLDTLTSFLGQQQLCYVATIFMDTIANNEEERQASIDKSLQDGTADAPFEKLAKQVLRWMASAFQPNDLTPEQVDDLIISDQDLLHILAYLEHLDDNPTPIRSKAIETFMGRHFNFEVQSPFDLGEGTANGAYYPMPISMRIEVSEYNGSRRLSYSFADYNVIDRDYMGKLKAHFDALRVTVDDGSATNEFDGIQTKRRIPNEELPESVASYIRSDYYLLIAKQMVKASRDALRNFKFHINGTETVGTLLDSTKTNGHAVDLYDLFVPNADHPLNGGKSLRIGMTVQYTANFTETFTGIAQKDFDHPVSAAEIAMANKDNSQILMAGRTITFGEQEGFIIRERSTIQQLADHFGVSLNELFVGSDLLVKTGYFKHNAELIIPLTASYTIESGTTFESIARDVFGNNIDPFTLAVTNLNSDILQPGTVISVNDRTHTVQAREDLELVMRKLGVSKEELLNQGKITSQVGLLRPFGQMIIPPFDYQTQNGDTLEGISKRFDVSIVLFLDARNNDQALFSASEDPFINLVHLERFKIGEIIKEIQRSSTLQHLSGMVSRYYMHGLRVPTEGITPKKFGMWVTVGVRPARRLELPEEAGIFALTGQQFPVPELTEAPLAITFSDAPSTWMQFVNENGTVDSLRMQINPGAVDHQRLQALQRFIINQRLDTGILRLGDDDMYDVALQTHSLANNTTWQAASRFTLPYGEQPSGVPSLKVWKLPDNLVNLPYPEARSLNPTFDWLKGEYNEVTGGTKESPLDYYGLASNIEFAIKKVQAAEGSAAAQNTYEIVSAATNDIVLMERLLTQTFGATDSSIFNKLILTYPGEKGGINSDVLETTTMGLTKVNLTTITLPPKEINRFRLAARTSETPSYGPNLLNAPSEFVQLLWEASITRSGGFYLYYYNQNRDAGLPDRIFNDKGEAKVNLIIIYAQTVDPSGTNRMLSFMNAAVNWERVDSAKASVVARAKYVELNAVQTLENETLNELAYNYYADVANIAASNKAVPLKSGVTLQIRNGIYTVPPAGIAPGGAIDQVAAHLGVKQAFLRKKNTRVEWSNPLPEGTAVYIPNFTYTVLGDGQGFVGGDPNNVVQGGSTLGAIATFYGLNVVALAADNADVPDLFEHNQQLTLLSGPSVRKATVPTDVMAVEVERPVPGENLDDPNDPAFAQTYLENMFHLMAYRITENMDYRGSSFSLPIGPTTVESGDIDKIDAIGALPESWEFRVSFPYLRYFKSGQNNNPETLPDGTNSPYRANGSLFQVHYEWRDLFGNLLMTKLTQPLDTDLSPYNNNPLKVGYIDAMIGLPKWPSVSSHYRVTREAGRQQRPIIEVNLSFDSSRYEGLLAVQVVGRETIVLTFTDAVHVDAALETDHYELSNGIEVLSARLANGNKQVELTTNELVPETTYELIVRDILSSDRSATFNGAANFSLETSSASPSPSKMRETAQRDLKIYEQLWYQLTDPHGIIMTLKTSLLTEPKVYAKSQQDGLVEDWLASIYQFVQDRANGQTSVAKPAASRLLTTIIEPDEVNTAQIFRLELALEFKRASGIVMGDMATTANIYAVASAIAPLTEEGATASRTLESFAAEFEATLSVPEAYKLKIATGVDRREFLYGRSGGANWVVRIGLTPETGIHYNILNPNFPTIFAPRPISNELQSRSGISILPYKTGVGLEADKAKPTDYIDIDMDVWGKQFVEAVDMVLTPRYTSALMILQQIPGSTSKYLEDILADKKTLADIIKNWMIPIFEQDKAKDDATAQEAFRQRLLTRLDNAYKTHAAIEFEASVYANIEEEATIASEPPRLFGNIRPTISASSNSDISYTSPKLTLATTEENQKLTFLLSAPGLVRGDDGEVLSNVDLKLTYEGISIEHQISPPPSEQSKPDPDQYKASSWLGFVLPEPAGPLTEDLGDFQVPLVLRSYPEIPTMVAQDQQNEPLNSNQLQDIIEWAYQFTYSRTFHYPQDRLHCSVKFNERIINARAADLTDAFSQLAQFLAAYPAIQKDLDTYLAPIDAKTVAALEEGAALPDEIVNAQLAIKTYSELLRAITTAATATTTNGLAMLRSPQRTSSTAMKEVNFVIQESVLEKNGQEVLLIGIFKDAPSGLPEPNEMGTIRIQIDGYRPIAEPAGTFGDVAYTFQSETDNTFLSAVDGQKILDREVVLPGLDILELQDAKSSMQIKRNEELIEGIRSQEAFIYTTGDVKFANPYLPLIDSEEEIDIAALPDLTPATDKQSLTYFFNNFFNNLLRDNSQSALTFQVNGRYQYELSEQLEPIFLPIFVHPPRTITGIDTTSGSRTNKMPADFIASLVDAITAWMTAQDPPQQLGSAIGLDVIVMTNLTPKPVPLLRLRGVKLGGGGMV